MIREYWIYFSKNGYMNSDGRKLLALLAKQAKNVDIHVSRMLWRLLKDPSIDNLVKLAKEIGVNIEDDLATALYGPYSWRFRSRSP